MTGVCVVNVGSGNVGEESEDFRTVGLDFSAAQTGRRPGHTDFGLPTLGLWTSGRLGTLGGLAESNLMNDHEGVRQTNGQCCNIQRMLPRFWRWTDEDSGSGRGA
jgi:hypothetical protein